METPRTFNEKIQWLKLYDRQPLYTKLADKYAVRQYVNDKIGPEYLNELYGVYESPAQIKYNHLPDSFVMKTTHGSGMNILVHSKREIDINNIAKRLKGWLKLNYYELGREWAYKDIPPKIICEKLLIDENGQPPQDFKVFCFNGTPQFIQVDYDRHLNHTQTFFDTYWKKLSFGKSCPVHDQEIKHPQRLYEMLWAATQLSRCIPFVRVDFYALPQLVFGEMTFYPGNGFSAFHPHEWDLKLGNLLELPSVRRQNK